MRTNFSLLSVARLLFHPNAVFKTLADVQPSAISVFLKVALWLGLLPPLFAYFGAVEFGWRLGAIEPLYLSSDVLLGISVAYFFALLVGFVSTAIVSQWMASTYEARRDLGVHFALISVVGSPIAIASIIHLYPNVFINILVFVLAILWSMFLLYRGLPITLHTTPEHGMLMASSLVGYFLVALVSLLGITVVLWSYGIGPSLGV